MLVYWKINVRRSKNSNDYSLLKRFLELISRYVFHDNFAKHSLRNNF